MPVEPPESPVRWELTLHVRSIHDLVEKVWPEVKTVVTRFLLNYIDGQVEIVVRGRSHGH